MSKYLLEIGVEELPYKFIPMAISQLESGFKTFLENNNVGFENIKVMATPRRLAVIISGLASSQPDVEKTVKVKANGVNTHVRRIRTFLNKCLGLPVEVNKLKVDKPKYKSLTKLTLVDFIYFSVETSSLNESVDGTETLPLGLNLEELSLTK